MANYRTQVDCTWTPEQAFDFMADLRNFASWDPGVNGVEQARGNGAGPVSEFDVAVAGPGAGTVMRYRTTSFNHPRSATFVAETARLRSVDQISVAPTSAGCTVTYEAELTLNGILGIADPLLGIAFRRIGDRAAAGLREALTQSPAEV